MLLGPASGTGGREERLIKDKRSICQCIPAYGRRRKISPATKCQNPQSGLTLSWFSCLHHVGGRMALQWLKCWWKLGLGHIMNQRQVPSWPYVRASFLGMQTIQFHRILYPKGSHALPGLMPCCHHTEILNNFSTQRLALTVNWAQQSM